MAHHPLLFSTTGLQDPVEFPDLGSRPYAHPTTDYDISEEFDYDSVVDSDSFLLALSNGWITVLGNDGSTITDPDGLWNTGEETIYMYAAPNVETLVSADQNPVVKATCPYEFNDLDQLPSKKWKGWVEPATTPGPGNPDTTLVIARGSDGFVIATLVIPELSGIGFYEIDFSGAVNLPTTDDHLELQANCTGGGTGKIHAGAFVFRG